MLKEKVTKIKEDARTQIGRILIRRLEETFPSLDDFYPKNLEEKLEADVDQILNLFKAEIDKLTVIDSEEIDKLWEQYEKENPDQGGLDTWDKWVQEAQLQHTQNELREGLEEG